MQTCRPALTPLSFAQMDRWKDNTSSRLGSWQLRSCFLLCLLLCLCLPSASSFYSPGAGPSSSCCSFRSPYRCSFCCP
ncbi:hypothetical protein EDC01DRAFT_133099 [Geopyxis carbonaria]|nr:hypothetical protein EDC01DRAFT_133099 [Geopyxis carbonaria]